MKNSFAEVHPELVWEWSERNLPLKAEDITYGSNKLYWWKGLCGHEWLASPKSRSAGEGCPICSGDRIVEGINDLRTLHPELMDEWSPKNHIDPSKIGAGSHKKAVWKDTLGHEWEAEIRCRVKGQGCPYCSHNKVLPGFNDLESRFPKVAAEWSERNYPLMPSQVTAFANRKVWWKCSLGHEWYTLISTRSGGSQCPYCSGIRLLKGFNDLATCQPELAKEWSERNLPITPEMVNEKSRKNVWWKCKTCGHEWKAIINSRVKGSICPVCADREVKEGFNDLATTDPELLEEWDYERNGDLKPSQVSRKSMRYVWWKCKQGHIRKERVSARTLEGNRCPSCEADLDAVLPQLLVLYYGKRHGVSVKLNDTELLGIPIEAYIPEINLAFAFPYKGTNRETRVGEVVERLCQKRGVTFIQIDFHQGRTELAGAIKRGFAKGNTYINSDSRADVEHIRQWFFTNRYK